MLDRIQASVQILSGQLARQRARRLARPLARAGLTWVGRRRLPRTSGTLYLAELEAPVEIIRDPWGVPHIYAENEHDLFFAQGFVHAQDRLWQMDFQRRLVAGRLAEVIGEEALQIDRWVRTLTMRRVAEEEARQLGDTIRAVLDAYAAGVNACLDQGRLPVEFTLLGYEPEPWMPADSLAWGKMMAWSLSVNWESELLRAQLIDRLGPELAAELEPGILARCPHVVPEELSDVALRTPLDTAAGARSFTGPTARDGVGSNNWVIGGGRTTTGAPILANDMHLGLGLPAIWYENHLIAPDLNVTGVSFPGTPAVVSGHNGHVAWGYTNGFSDVQDLYVEHLRRTAGGGIEAEFEGAWEAAEVVHEEIKVKGREIVTEEVVITRHGPIINALAPDEATKVAALTEPSDAAETGLALRWTALEPGTLFDALYAMNHAEDCNAFSEALRLWTTPIQNIVYADTQGTIAYSLPGKIPIRAKGHGRVPVPGWTGEYEWTGYIPFDELPHLVDPPHGYIVTANNRVVNGDYPYDLGYDTCMGDRAQRITELIEAREAIDVGYVEEMHFDQLSPTGRWMADFLGGLTVDDPDLVPLVDLMRGWDGTLIAGSTAAAVYEVFMREITYLLLRPRLGDLAVRYAGKGPTPQLASVSIFGYRSWEWLLTTLQSPTSPWFDLPGEGREDAARHDVVRRALAATREYLEATLGPDIDAWAWGRLHTLTFDHILGRMPPLDRVFNRGPYPVGGDGSTVWATTIGQHDLSSQRIVGPVYRMIVDLGNLRKSVGLLAPGQSGQIGSPHYDDQIDDWFTRGYHPILYTRDDVNRAASATLNLRPW